jgi:hypothetical protein
VRAAAARWADAAARAGALDPALVRAALERCGLADPDPTVRDACHDPALPALDDRAEVYAWSSDRRRLLTHQLVALRFADGTVLVTHADANGVVSLDGAPRGAVVLEDPTATPLER